MWRVIFNIRVSFGVGLKDEKLIKKQTYTQTEAYKLYSGVFRIFLQNVIKIDPYNFDIWRFKFGAFFETQCTWLKALAVTEQATRPT